VKPESKKKIKVVMPIKALRVLPQKYFFNLDKMINKNKFKHKKNNPIHGFGKSLY
jgi:hypothetical protein